MAWTWSAPQRGALSFTTALAPVCQALRHRFDDALAQSPARGAFAASTGVLTGAGVLAPLMAAETLTALLFTAAAAAASMLVFRLRETTAPTTQNAFNPALSMSSRSTSVPQTRFRELLPRDAQHASLDRARWSQLTAHMSHELRTPLNAVLGFSEMMSKEVFGPMGSHCYSDYARNIHASGRMLLKTAEDALAITALLSAPEHRRVPLTACLSTAIADATAFHADTFSSRRIAVSFCDPDRAVLIADPQIVRQLFINLLADAVTRVTDDDTISITARVDAGSVEIAFEVLPDPQRVDLAQETFAILLASTLAELSGAPFAISTDMRTGLRTCDLTFTVATQQDFFALSDG
ncbi:MAG: HAMP domain-containing histidine kinase [Hyphomicrobium sp.]|nr:HAMP domain-containing histidine kinase [Hyphomicrobium sp.]